MSAPLWLIEIEAYDPGTASVVTLRYSSGGGHTTKPSETPANTWYDARLSNPLQVTRSLFGGARTSGRARSTAGDIKLNNADGGLDALLAYGADGRDLVLRYGEVGAAYPAGFPVVFQGTVDVLETRREEVIIRARDQLFALQSPLQTTTYAGDNALPDGVEGVAGDLKRKPKPFALGTVKNIAPPCVNTAKLIYQTADLSPNLEIVVNRVCDSGIELGGPTSGLMIVAGLDEWISSSGDGVRFSVKDGAFPFTTGFNGRSTTVTDGHFLETLGDSAHISTDGVVWATDIIGIGADTRAIASDGTTVIVADGVGSLSSKLIANWGNNFWSSISSATTGFGASTIYALIHNGTRWIAAGGGGAFSTSTNGTTWTFNNTAENLAFLALAYDGSGLHVAVGEQGTLWTSPDGLTWTDRTAGGGSTGGGTGHTRDIGHIVYGGGRWLYGARTNASGTDGTEGGGACFTSTDGITWTRVDTLPITFDVTALGYGHDRYFVGGADGRFWSSPDMVTWTPVSLGLGVSTDNAVHAIMFREGSTPSTYASEADLLDETLAPLPGMYRAYPAGGLIRLGSPPAGLVTCDITATNTGSYWTAGSMFENVLTKAGYTSADWSASDVTALDAANSAICGLWFGPDERPTTAEALDRIAQSVGAAWWAASDGTFRIRQFTAPSGTADIEITANDLLEPLSLVPTSDAGHGRPTFRTVVRYAKNHIVQATDIALGVTDARRAELAAAWREVEAVDASVQTAHLLARESIVETLFATAAAAQTEATRLQTLHGTRRQVYEAVVPLTAETAVIDLFDVVKITHTRFSLSAGKLTRVLSVTPDAAQKKVRWQLWG